MHLLYIGTCEVGFVSSSYTVSEDAGSVNVCVEITDLPSGGLASDLTVELSFSDGPKSGTHYVFIMCAI